MQFGGGGVAVGAAVAAVVAAVVGAVVGCAAETCVGAVVAGAELGEAAGAHAPSATTRQSKMRMRYELIRKPGKGKLRGQIGWLLELDTDTRRLPPNHPTRILRPSSVKYQVKRGRHFN